MLTFKDLSVGDRFSFKYEYGWDYEWMYSTKTGPYSYETQPWPDGSGRAPGRVGVGDQIVVRKKASA